MQYICVFVSPCLYWGEIATKLNVYMYMYLRSNLLVWHVVHQKVRGERKGTLDSFSTKRNSPERNVTQLFQNEAQRK